MLNKNQNPWSYEPTEWPNDKETAIINSVFGTFESVIKNKFMHLKSVFNLTPPQIYDRFVPPRVATLSRCPPIFWTLTDAMLN